jgi:hypothetical protein
MCSGFRRCILYLPGNGQHKLSGSQGQILVLGNSIQTAEGERGHEQVVHGREDNEDIYKIIHDSTERPKKGKGVLLRTR